ncbi:MAG: uracil-DNA glycosylase [Candidatus Taylorbacteria bacterium]|nr:uracil-DNA glycosylase [Candidatus Taylorbacteria bacterium]
MSKFKIQISNQIQNPKTDLMKVIKDEIFVLKESPLFEYRTTNKYFPVIGEGSHDAKIMFVGEAPGRNEAKTGRPFCGAAGKVLDQLLAHVGISRGSIYITNIVKDRPPENRDPTSREIEVYGPFLDRQIEIIQPRVVVALGRYAMGYIMQKFHLDLELETIGKAHGKAYPAKASYGDIDVVILYHPCVGVYNPNNIPNLKKDFEVLKGFAKAQ